MFNSRESEYRRIKQDLDPFTFILMLRNNKPIAFRIIAEEFPKVFCAFIFSSAELLGRSVRTETRNLTGRAA